MTYASSVSSAEASAPNSPTTAANNNSMSAKINKAFGQKGRPQIKISLNGCEDSWVATYSTMERIEGKVFITCPTTTPVASLSIDFIGATRTYLERLSSSTAVSGRSEAHHQFLKLTQPIPETAWPQNRVFEAGETYEFGFVFVVPPMLLPRVCRHSITSTLVQNEHLKLPPSFGDKSISGRGQQLLDDLAPEMARIRYCVSVSLRETPRLEGLLDQPIVKNKKVRILPRVEEDPPVSTEGHDSDYILRSEKDVRKGLFKGKLGRLVVETVQPKSIRIRSHKSEEQAPESTMIKVNLRFDPAESQGAAPKLGSLCTRLKVATFFSSSARAKLPARNDTQWDMNQGLHSEQINLATRCLGHIEWTWNSDADLSRRSSAVSSLSDDALTVPEPSKKYKGEGYWTAQIALPVSLPTNKAWIPTFHSCLVSRTYSLGVHVALNTGSIGSGVDLKVPIQLSSEGGPEVQQHDRRSVSLEEQAAEAIEADDFFAPRTISPIDASFTGRSSIGHAAAAVADSDLPPEYDAFPRSSNMRAIMA